MIFNYQEISQDLLNNLSKREREIIARRFGFKKESKETLQEIGGDFGITRERVRQIEIAGLAKLKVKVDQKSPAFQFFLNQFKSSGKLRKEAVLLGVLSPDLSFKNYVSFLLFLGEPFERFNENNDFHSLWTIDRKALEVAAKVVKTAAKKIEKKGKLVEDRELEFLLEIDPVVLFSSLEVSKKIKKGPQGLWGLNDWPEVNPRGIRDKAYIIFNREKKPLHFREVANLIDASGLFVSRGKKTHPQTVHNELIKDNHFVLVGRGIYALKEWGYEPGLIKDIVVKVLKEAKHSLSREEIIEKVLKQRVVERNTILLNLRNKKLFVKDSKGNYKLRRG